MVTSSVASRRSCSLGTRISRLSLGGAFSSFRAWRAKREFGTGTVASSAAAPANGGMVDVCAYSPPPARSLGVGAADPTCGAARGATSDEETPPRFPSPVFCVCVCVSFPAALASCAPPPNTPPAMDAFMSCRTPSPSATSPLSMPFSRILSAFSGPLYRYPNAAHSDQNMACFCQNPSDLRYLNVSRASSMLLAICCLARPRYRRR